MPLLGSMMPQQGPGGRSLGRLVKRGATHSDKAHQMIVEARDDLADTVIVCMAAGVGFLVSPTSDGGAVSVTVYSGDKRERDYAGHPDELAMLFSAVRDFAEAALYQGTQEGAKVVRRPAS